jgi:histidyl-tRNA synthetase
MTVELLKGFQDFLPEAMIPRAAIIRTIQELFERYGFMPQETPALEYAELLLGKYGEEEKLIYQFADKGGRQVALRYDLTVPLARVVSMYRHQLPMPYKRYQAGMVWRAEKPQKGRFREFLQFDADIAGSASTLADAEILSMVCATMDLLQVNAVVRVNDRRILNALLASLGLDAQTGNGVLVALDKNDRVGTDGVLAEIAARGYAPVVADGVHSYLDIQGSNAEILARLQERFAEFPEGLAGIQSLSDILDLLIAQGIPAERVVVDTSIARGLDYYTGMIFETRLVDLPGIGSVCSGGRYDRLIGSVSGQDVPAVGLSVGVDRLIAALQSLGRLNPQPTLTQVLIAQLTPALNAVYCAVAAQLRRAGVRTEIYLEERRLSRQIQWADRQHIPIVIIIGEDEVASGEVVIKDLRHQQEHRVPGHEVVARVQACLAE